MAFLNIDPTIDYVNSIVNGTDNAQDLDVKISSTPPPPQQSAHTNHSAGVSYPSHSTLDQRLEKLERMLITTFDAVRQLSHQIYSVDTKLADLVAQSTVASLSVAHQQGMLPNHGDLQQSIGPNHSKIQVQFGQQQTETPTLKPGNTNTNEGTHKSWDSRLEELKGYKTAHGHCNVPQVHEGGLGSWVSVQRNQKKRFNNAKTSTMTQQRRKALEKLGFSWTLRKRHSWEERYFQLKTISDANGGTCDVLNEGQTKGLWTWCQNQRDAYRKGVEGKGTAAVSKERVQMMQRVGFNWLLPVESVSISVLPAETSSSASSSQTTQDSPLTDAMDSSVPSVEI